MDQEEESVKGSPSVYKVPNLHVQQHVSMASKYGNTEMTTFRNIMAGEERSER